ncbi:sugar phosphate nucleotidyltransferase [Weizmannia coagulans]|uniref:Mannose-6-phosphate isomerase n=2 Tax=Heyndrickxia TaxID=2837504 RepID=A0AAN0T7Q9_HEYCO|nr:MULTISPECIES: sugar phosphate nucleotidyltransferase [Heyndrickxia]AJO24447.1 mannose-6-phosphate isomerase [Heyndrickxia coagulans]AKN54087.1 Mannose-1-phosphate guanylyltransferase (GDP) [Heyndrickxia coagulans]APB38215.1 mannose-1-phosphate guanylyltransferase [Heyndrickxia coagulans]ATW84268.1 mannose-1-phosphate guanylyltransferase [Heyndrickxia coagulans]KGB30362.1 mannose-1-phosphate guanylyltransferase [Heyndrickxia coagulans]
MKIILLSGGSGKRLWPLSNDARSKQFLKVLENKNHNLESMVQRVWSQLKQTRLNNSTVIATSKSQVEMIQSQLNGEADLIVEPTRRDTFPAIALAVSYLYTNTGARLDEVVGVLPVDPYVETSFFDRVKDLEMAIQKSESDLALIGVKPTYPSEKYGYIVPEDDSIDSSQVIKVSRFTEKPNENRARELLKQGAMWNCGVFAFRLGYLINLLEEKHLPIHYEELLKQYARLPKISFDYEVVEKAKNIIALQYNGYWKDLGTWNTLTEEMGTNKIGNGIISEDSINTHLINEIDIPVTILGVSNAVIAVSPDGILVSDKEKSPKIKELVSTFNDRPMYEERRWGWYRVLDHVKYNGTQEVLTKKIGIKAGSNLSYQYHLARKETWTVVKGEGVVALNGSLQVVKAGDVLQVEIGDKHAIKATTELEMIEVQSGTEILEEDIVRIFMDWDEIEDYCYSIK